MAFCANCGEARPMNGRFCSACGASFEADNRTDAAATQAVGKTGQGDVGQWFKQRWQRTTVGERIMLGGFGVALLSLFLPWVDVGFATRSGWSELGWLWTALGFGYVVAMFVQQRAGDRRAYLASTIVALVVGFLVLFGNLESIKADGFVFTEDQLLDFNGAGVYVFILAAIAGLVGAVKHPKPAN